MKFIACIDSKNGIGKDNKLAWKNSIDLKFFKKTTTNKTIIMGMNTFKSCGLLPNRENIILSKTIQSVNNTLTTTTFDRKRMLELTNAYCIGGQQIYNLFFENELLDEGFLSILDNDYGCDTFFPIHYLQDWKKELILEHGELKIWHYMK